MEVFGPISSEIDEFAGTGVGVGIIGGWLDVLVEWCGVFLGLLVNLTEEHLSRLSDLRHGRCVYGFFYNQVACCSGLDRELVYLVY